RLRFSFSERYISSPPKGPWERLDRVSFPGSGSRSGDREPTPSHRARCSAPSRCCCCRRGRDADGSPKKAVVMHAELKKAGLYTEAQRATVEGWQKLRNDAAHGNPGFDGDNTSL